MPVMMNAAKVGPRKIPMGSATRPSRGLLSGRRPAPSSESTHGAQAIHEKAKAITKKETSG
jgi:hypothetical protein